ncbi:MAG: phosphoenolpyruvate--protein phosphotransferase [Alphaproteobacteria bacterium]|nr:phosphoenolpyruvate--protein phosphotransferase [Alphaproteobacteria bacterium]
MPPSGTLGGGSRQLLKRLRDVMAGQGTGQERLDRIVRVIAQGLVAEVCSCYLVRGGMLELFATEGLRPGAVHQTRLAMGEGLVGDIAAHARPLALADAQSHPNFAYRPETGEEIFHSLMGAPILRGGRVLGVVVVQNRTKRHYAEDEVETLETVAMVMAELVSAGLVSDEEALAAEQGEPMPARLEGIHVHDGVAVGTAVFHRPRIEIRRVVAEDPEAELVRLEAAVGGLQRQLDELFAASELARAGEHEGVLEAYRMFALDRGWNARLKEAIRSGLTAEAAVQKVQNDTRARLAQVVDPYLRERLMDLDDLHHRMIQHLTGDAGRRELPDDAILIARTMGPAELLDYDRARLKALVLEEGSATAHVAIIARALDLPTVARVPEIRDKVSPGDRLIVDGTHGVVYVRPGDDVIDSITTLIAATRAAEIRHAGLRDMPAVSLDGVKVSLNLNAGLLVDLAQLDRTGADGIGLYRTEIGFMVRPRYPTVSEQTAMYQQVLAIAGERPVVFRTLDAGGDKRLPYLSYDEDENPAMGWRAIRMTLDRPSLLRQQLRAMLAAAAGGPLSVMFPMVAEVAELVDAKLMLDLELDRLRQAGAAAPEKLRVGAMIEVPALLHQLPALLPRVDFLSVGSNDLLQFLFAADRGSPRLAGRYDPLSPAVLSLMARLIAEAGAGGVPVTVCGEMAGRPLEAMTLIGLGFSSLSMSAGALPPVKAMIRSLDVRALAAYLDRLIRAPDRSVREKLRAFAADHGIAI